jgi:NAD(P)-dependent dehydrogenase (short-subunit alcohol dehydrogenase family)
VKRLEGKTAIVTGASMGIGRAIARRLHSEGAALVLVSRGREAGEQFAGELGAEGGQEVRFLPGDVTDPVVADRAVEEAAKLGGVDVLVNNAGLDLAQDFLDTDEDDARRIFETNVFGTLWMLRRVARELSESARGGSIVNISSRLASIGVPRMVVYGASKGAVSALTRGAAVELAPMGIRVNAVAPGMAATPMFKTYIAEEADGEDTRRRVVAAIPQGRLAEPEDIAAAVAYLAADESAHITGASIPIDGGYTAA